METYFYKMILLSAIFILGYFLFLEKEKNHVFKRFYLLASIMVSMLIPLITITYGIKKVEQISNINQENWMIMPETEMTEPSLFTLENVLIFVYFSVFSILFLKFSWGINQLLKEIRTTEKIKQPHYFILLKENKITPYSFWNYIFLYKNDFLEGKIDEKILLHEKTHIQQKHSLDILFIELLLCVFWFNPAFYFYKKAMITNHEFLADEIVLAENKDIENYQKLILNELISEKILFTHPFNLHNTKKRMNMMTTKLTKIAKLKSYLTLPISAVLFFAFAEKVPAKIIVDNKDRAQAEKSSEKKPALKQVNLEEYLPKIEKQNLAKDTIKPKGKKAEKEFKNKINENIPEAKSTDNQIPPPAPIEKTESETPPEFPGGMNALRQKLMQNFDTSKLGNSKEPLKGTIKIVVSEDGKKYDANYEFENENFGEAAKYALEKSLDGVTWKPGTQNGKPVASHVKLPLTMIFE